MVIPTLCRPNHLQVSTTQKIAVGQWVRLWVQQPSRPTVSRRLLSQHEALATGSRRKQLLQARGGSGSNASASASTTRYLPLSEAAAAARFSFASEAEHSGAVPQRPTTASAGGTLDAHLYGENAVDSGAGKERWTTG